MRILLVEDDITRSEVLCSVLVAEGYTVTPAFDGYEAIDFIRAHKFDLIVSDVDLGASPDGFQVYREFKAAGGKENFVMYTSSSFEGLESLAKDLGILNFISNAQGNLMDIKKAVVERLNEAIKRNTDTTNKLLGMQ